ncbi:MAG: hypothetical protein JJ848_000180 [Prochlorococcus marinus CUG1439]|uniref:hypothetical protein n=1 Tax=Prochlorococcus sp. MIT 1314 TaxID=3096220 RepID=UPI001B1FCC4F|nr:hypothetical protein [Prochlorococcus sp. MIT 1314]MCR8538759.1 hypothetical protein [Prochlorococcus marinus CUG1439]
MDKKISIKNLTIITPFKDKSTIKLNETIYCLYKQNLNLLVQHLILHDTSCDNILDTKKLFPSKRNYIIKFIPINEKGIYSAINKGLDLLKKESYYIVIGAGDQIFLNNLKEISINKLLMCQYKLSNKNENINKLRNLYTGMPYCHNAIIFRVNNLRYSKKYSISSDYDYFLKFIKHEQINLYKNDYFNKKINIIFESESGISSRSIFKKNYENLFILYKNFGFKYIFFYILLKIKKLIKNIYE